MALVLGATIETTRVALLIDCPLIKIYRRHNSRLMIKHRLNRHVTLVRFLQLWQETRDLIVQFKFLLVVSFHHRQQRTGRLRHGSQIIYRFPGYLLTRAIIIKAECLVVNNQTVFSDQHPATGISLLLKSLIHDRLDHVQAGRISVDLFRLMITKPCLLGKQASPRKIKPRYRHRQFTLRPNSTINHLSGELLRQWRTLITHDNRLCRIDRLLIILASVGQGEKGQYHLLLIGQLPKSLALRNTNRMDSTNHPIIFRQLRINPVHLSSRGISPD